MKFCPDCGADLTRYNSGGVRAVLPVGSYNQTAMWRTLVTRAQAIEATPPAPEALVLPAVARLEPALAGGSPVKTIIHLVFDRDVVPRGGALHLITMSEGKAPFDLERAAAMGYAVVDGKVLSSDDIPVGPAYQLLDYWGGERQHKRWHLDGRCELNPSRNGDPFFMDANMIAFGATWKNSSRMEASLLELLEMFIHGFGDHRRTVGIPLVLEMVQH